MIGHMKITVNLHAGVFDVGQLDTLHATRIVVGGFLRLGKSDAVDEESDATLGDDIRNSVAHLDCYHCAGRESSLARRAAREDWEEVDDWVGAPRDDSRVACPLDGILDLWGLSFLSCLQSDEESVHDVAEWDHRDAPEEHAWGDFASDFARAAETPRVVQRDLVQEGESPMTRMISMRSIGTVKNQSTSAHKHLINILHLRFMRLTAVGIVEWNSGWVVSVEVGVALVVVDLAIDTLAWSVGLFEGVEDAEVVVHCDG